MSTFMLRHLPCTKSSLHVFCFKISQNVYRKGIFPGGAIQETSLNSDDFSSVKLHTQGAITLRKALDGHIVALF
jgi:hypothetical protein